jgi:starch phosphorylase
MAKIKGHTHKKNGDEINLADIKESLSDHLLYSVGKDSFSATARDWFFAAAYSVRDHLIERWMESMRNYYDKDAKRVYYLSMEFLIGRTMSNGMISLGLDNLYHQAASDLGHDLDDLQGWEVEPALGTGGLGRLAACLLDSLASMDIPGFGYGIRYEFGMFTQHIENGTQVEAPENWLRYGNPWEFPRPGVLYPVRFGGRVNHYIDHEGKTRSQWVDSEEVMAMAYDLPIPGYGGRTVNNLRLWSAKSTREFNFKYFNAGNYIDAVKDKNESETLSKVLYPSDTTTYGKELRFKQEYFFVSASIQDILTRYRKHHSTYDQLGDKVAIQLNDTHPALGVAELMRILIDEQRYEFAHAWSICKNVFGYTNHTLMPEALETWPIDLFGKILPRHLEIVFEINQIFLDDVRHRFPGDVEFMRRLSLIDEAGGRRVRMANLAFLGSHRVNGVARIHTDLMKSSIFKDFERYQPGKITCITNGITPRRWLMVANPGLSKLITDSIGDGWKENLDRLRELEPFAENADFRKRFRAIKAANKERLAHVIQSRLAIDIKNEALFDVMVKRMHEYKRQLLNVLHIITRYNRIRHGNGDSLTPRVIIIGGKAAPGYAMAKLIVKLINDVSETVNNDPAVGDKLKLVFVPNYNVSTAELIIPAADLSEQISTAGTEASGTGNMKLSLNGALTIGTWDGANVEIAEEVGPENIFTFGLTADQAIEARRSGHDPWSYYNADPELKEAVDMISNGFFSADQADRFRPIIDALTHGGDYYLLFADYRAYVDCQAKVDDLYRHPEEWTRKAVLNVARMGKFSSDRTVADYCREVWGAVPISKD